VPAQCLVVSHRNEDLKLGQYLAANHQFAVRQTLDVPVLTHLMAENPQSIVLWDGENPILCEQLARVLQDNLAAQRVFVITDNALNTYPHLFRVACFSHHLFRRFSGPALEIYSRLATGALLKHPFGLHNYFSEGLSSQKIQILHSTHRSAAVQAVQNYLSKMKVTGRLASLVARSTDELLMNAIFDAPINIKGEPYRRKSSRDADFELIGREQVQVEVIATPDYIGVSVADQFGTLNKDVLLGFLGTNWQKEIYRPRASEPGAGIGLNGTIQAGLSLLFVSRPGVRTEVMLFFPTTENYKEFRDGFRFLSILAE
jgi:hypothetical protein